MWLGGHIIDALWSREACMVFTIPAPPNDMEVPLSSVSRSIGRTSVSSIQMIVYACLLLLVLSGK